MKIVTIRKHDRFQVGIKTERGILVDPEPNGTIEQLIQDGREGLRRLEETMRSAETDGSDAWLSENEVELGPCVPNPGKIICLGLNYRRHAEESKMAIPATPVIFSKYNNALAGHLQPVVIPPDTVQMDYEAELAVVIGKQARQVSKEEALGYVFGYCSANDLSARDLQFRSTQWLLGKTCDGFCPLGPYLVTADEVEDPDNLSINCKVNGETRQQSNTSDMIFNTRQIISYVSTYMTLNPGDVILTGTPEGVVFGYPADRQTWLESGDVVTVEIEGLGALTNSILAKP